jgi:hypothetical protein
VAPAPNVAGGAWHRLPTSPGGRRSGAYYTAGNFSIGPFIAAGVVRHDDFTDWHLNAGAVIQLPFAAIAGLLFFEMKPPFSRRPKRKNNR